MNKACARFSEFWHLNRQSSVWWNLCTIIRTFRTSADPYKMQIVRLNIVPGLSFGYWEGERSEDGDEHVFKAQGRRSYETAQLIVTHWNSVALVGQVLDLFAWHFPVHPFLLAALVQLRSCLAVEVRLLTPWPLVIGPRPFSGRYQPRNRAHSKRSESYSQIMVSLFLRVGGGTLLYFA